MHTLNSFAALVLLAYASGATAAASSAFTVHQEETGRRRDVAGPIVYEKGFWKYGVTPPAHVRAAAANAKKKGSVKATPEQFDLEYLCPVKVGTPPRTLMLNFDTGSSDLWVFSSEQPSSQTQGHTIYDPSASSSSQYLSGYSWNITYQDGSGAYGDIYADTVTIGGITANSQAVEAAQSVSNSLVQDTDVDGLVGLAYRSLNTAKPVEVSTFYENVRSSLRKPIFAAYLRKGQPGSYDFGFIDKKKFTGTVVYSAVNTNPGYWRTTAAGYAIGTSVTQQSLDMIADTGTTLLYLPSNIVSAYYAEVQGASYSSQYGGYTFPCDTQLPNFSLLFKQQLRTVPGSYINYGPLNSVTCFGGMQPNTGLPFTVVGDIFLKSQYVVFDGVNNRLGFANQRL